MPQRFAGRVAFITGGANGLGRAFAGAFSAEGAAVAIADIDLQAAERAAAELAAPGTPVIALECDVADERSVERAVRLTVEKLGGVDILINNAARHLSRYAQPFSALTREEIRALFDVNVLGVINCSLACRESMSRRGGGVILNMASSAGFSVTTPYGVSKLAVRGLTISFATQFSRDKIRVNGVAPVFVGTESVLADFREEDIDAMVDTRQLIRRRCTLDDVTRVVLFLCSEDAAFVTGETMRVTGGAYLAI
jgi:NAD(P)-dependent dehydrogenase (short-subunit alcohol dehydrogenase family)